MAWSPWSFLCPSAQQLISKKKEKRRSKKNAKTLAKSLFESQYETFNLDVFIGDVAVLHLGT